jgi:hypothetical protein
MTDQMTRVVPAGWYDDPKSSEHVRWWNGLGWTDHVEVKPTAPAAQPAAAAPAPEPAPEPAKPQIGLGFGGGYYAQKYARDDD